MELIHIIGITLIIIIAIIAIVLIAIGLDKQTFYNFTLPILGKKYDLKSSTLVPGFKNHNEEASSEEPSSEEASSEEPPLVGLYKSKQLYLRQFPKMRSVSNERPHNVLPNEPTMRKILEDLSNSGIIV